MNRVTYRVALEVASHEAIVRQAYRDSVGVWTWSVGITNASGHNVERYIDNPQPMDRCLAVFAWALEKYADDVRRAFGRDLTEAQFAAALSFNYNTGAIGRATWVKHWKAGNIANARKSFMDWRKPAEIIPRRKKERDLFFDGVWSNNGTILEYTRVTSSHAPDWSSGQRVNVEGAMKAALGGVQAPVPPDIPMPPEQPSRPPAAKPAGKPSLIGGLVAIAAAIAAALAMYFNG